MNFTRRNLLALAAVVGIAGGASGAYAADTLNVGSYPSNPPFEYKADTGVFEGFEVDIVTEAAKRAGLTPEDLVIIDGLVSAAPGSKVTPQAGTIGAAEASSGNQG